VRFLPRGHPHLQRHGGGTVMATAACCGPPPTILVPPYDALKAAMLTMSKVLAKTHGPEGIR
jgi:3-oxoacyl-[acyl-carrier protein] reductase